MVVIEIERNDETVGAILFQEDDTEGERQFWEIEGDICLRDIDADDIFDTDDFKLRIDIDEYIDEVLERLERKLNPFRSANYIGFYHENDNVKGLVQELASYRRLLESYDEGDYYNCGVLIENYFGHIDYWKEFGYDKTHAEIVSILHTNLLSEISGNTANSFTSFCEREINKIIYTLKEDYGIEDVDKLMEENWLP